MTGSGSATVAYALESTYNSDPSSGTPTYRNPGRNFREENAELSNELRRIFDPGDVETVESLAENLAGAAAFSWTLSGNQFHELVFNNDTDGSGLNDSWTSGLAQSATWYLGLDYPSGGSVATAQRALTGWAPTQWELTWQQGEPPRVRLTGIYADEKTDTSITPSSITNETDVVASHGFDFTIDGTTQSREQSVTLSVSPIARPQRGSSRYIDQVVMAGPTPTLTIQSIFTETDQLELSYGSAGSTSTQDDVGGVSASITATDGGGTTIADYSLSAVTPDTYTWNDLVNRDEQTSMTEEVQFQVNGLTAAE